MKISRRNTCRWKVWLPWVVVKRRFCAVSWAESIWRRAAVSWQRRCTEAVTSPGAQQDAGTAIASCDSPVFCVLLYQRLYMKSAGPPTPQHDHCACPQAAQLILLTDIKQTSHGDTWKCVAVLPWLQNTAKCCPIAFARLRHSVSTKIKLLSVSEAHAWNVVSKLITKVCSMSQCRP